MVMTDAVQRESLTRREFLGRSIGAGFALATLPVAAWAITTSGEGLETGPIAIPTAGGPMPGYFAAPRGKGRHPVVIVVQEIFGVHEYIQDVCRRFAKLGYFAVAPSLYFRQGDATKIEDIQKLIAEIVSKVDQDGVWSDLDATVKWAGGQKQADVARLGITGFCWGGNAVWTYCAHNPKVKAGVAWYGRVAPPPAGTPSAAKPYKTPLELAPKLRVAVLGLYGGKDKGIPQEDLEKMRGELAKGQSGSEIVVYPEAEHGFHADYRPSYNEKAAVDGWGRALAWFKKHGV